MGGDLEIYIDNILKSTPEYDVCIATIYHRRIPVVYNYKETFVFYRNQTSHWIEIDRGNNAGVSIKMDGNNG